MSASLAAWVKEIDAHLFNEISLAGREKFHTGFLAFALRKEDASSESTDLLRDVIWPDFKDCGERIEVQVEKNSLDLSLSRNGKTVAFCEVKIASKLSNRQLENYLNRTHIEQGSLLTLSSPAISVGNNVHILRFKDIIQWFDNCENAWHEKWSLSDAEAALLRLWVSYLKPFCHFLDEIEEMGLSAVDERWFKDAERLKLRKILERNRLKKVRVALLKVSEFPLLNAEETSQSEGVAELFNSNGNAGLNLNVGVLGSNHPKLIEDYSYGLQWQAGSLKLFLCAPNQNYSCGEGERETFLKAASIYIQNDLDNPHANIGNGR